MQGGPGFYRRSRPAEKIAYRKSLTENRSPLMSELPLLPDDCSLFALAVPYRHQLQSQKPLSICRDS
jgi:hypothetical protein